MTYRKFSSLIKFLDYVIEILFLEKKNLLNVDSNLALEISLLIASHTMKNDLLTLKSLFLKVQSNEDAVSKQLERLIDMNLCVLVANESDGRTKFIVAQVKMIELLTQYSISVLGIRNQSLSSP